MINQRNIKTFSLILIALLLYGIIGFKIKNSVSVENKIVSNDLIEQPQNIKIKANSNILELNYRNPFSIKNKIHSAFTKDDIRSNKTYIKSKKQKKDFLFEKKNWSGIKVKAIISGYENKLCIIEIEDKEIVMREAQVEGGYKLISIFHDSITIRFNKENKTFRL